MRKLFSVGALVAASILGIAAPAMAGQPVVVIRPHHHYWRHHRVYRHSGYYDRFGYYHPYR